MKLLYKVLSGIIIYVLFANTKANAQGCVAISGKGAFSVMEHPMLDSGATPGDESSWVFTSSYRYFHSYKHFKGTQEQKQRQTLHNEVVNFQNTIDLSLTRNFDRFWSVTVGIPYLINIRSSLYEHGGKERHRSYSHGFGDARVVGYRWLFDPRTSHNGNLQLGLGVKLPTGDYNYYSYFYNVTPSKRPVDQSIQLGDGGVGIIAELNGFLHLGGRFSGYTNLYYMANPRNTNGTRTYRESLSAALANEDIMSVPDQYLARVGVNYTFGGSLSALTASVGGRIEGIPPRDLIGQSNGFRRPGYIISGEPSLNYSMKRVNLFASVPIALKRNRQQSVTDKENSIKTGAYVIGDAAFADYSINLGISFKF